MLPSRLYLCIDLGGTKTSAAISNQSGDIVSRGTAGPANYNDVGSVPFVEAVQLATERALRSLVSEPILTLTSGSTETLFHTAWIGGSGIDKPQDIVDLLHILSPLLRITPETGRLKITNDTHLLASPLHTYVDATTAIVVIAGTGSNVSAFRRAGRGSLEEAGRMGGWGWILGDEGSGFHVGKEALRMVLSTADQVSCQSTTSEPKKDQSPLEKAVFAHFGINSAYELFSVVYAPEPTSHNASKSGRPVGGLLAMERKHRIASMTPAIFDLAFGQSDHDALAVLRSTTCGLARSIKGLVKHGDRGGMDATKTVLCFGGSLVGVEAYRQLILDDLRNDGVEFLAAAFVGDAAAAGAESLSRTYAEYEMV